jgi:hypothetical protein
MVVQLLTVMDSEGYIMGICFTLTVNGVELFYLLFFM